MFIDIHVLQTVPYSNLNRDDTGTPKTVVYGGSTRARVSSQSWKRAARKHLEELLATTRTFRTRNPDQRLAEILVERGTAPEAATVLAKAVFKALGTATKDGSDNVIIFVSESELGALADVVTEHVKELTTIAEKVKGDAKPSAELTKAIKACLTVNRPTSIALFGRMLASAPDVNVDASVQVAHAFSVHAAEIEVDYFTAAEDLPEPDDLTGGAHIGTAEFVAATFYRYATIDFGELLTNTGGDLGVAQELANLVALAFCLSLPSGKNNVTAPHSVPDLVEVVVRDSRPVSYAAAFERPVRRAAEGGYAHDAVGRLANHAGKVARMLSEPATLAGFVSVFDDVDGLGAEHDDLGALIGAAIDAASAGER